VEKPQLPRWEGGGSPQEALKGHREVRLGSGSQGVPIYERGRLGVGAEILGPAIVEEPDSTTVVFPEQRLTVDEYGNLLIEGAKGGS